MAEDAVGGPSEVDLRRKKALFRANHRGTKEMDWMLGRYAEAHLGDMDEETLGNFERLLVVSDPELQKWLLGDGLSEGEFAPLVTAIRRFHGLDTA